MNRVFDYPVKRGGEAAWIPGADGTMKTVRATIRKNNILFTRLATEAQGSLYDLTIMSKGKGQAPIKTNKSIERYGGYNKVSGTYFFLVEQTAKKGRARSIEPVYLMYKALYEKEPLRYCKEILKLNDPRIILPKIKINSLLSFDGFRMHVSGRTGTQIIYKSANQLILSPRWHTYIKAVSKYSARCRAAGKELELTNYDVVTKEENQSLYDIIAEKLSTRLFNIKYDTPFKTLYSCREKFCALTALDQCNVLLQIIAMLHCNAVNADLKLLNGKAGIGMLLTSKNLDNYRDHAFELINQSITGVFEQRINLLTYEPAERG